MTTGKLKGLNLPATTMLEAFGVWASLDPCHHLSSFLHSDCKKRFLSQHRLYLNACTFSVATSSKQPSVRASIEVFPNSAIKGFRYNDHWTENLRCRMNAFNRSTRAVFTTCSSFYFRKVDIPEFGRAIRSLAWWRFIFSVRVFLFVIKGESTSRRSRCPRRFCWVSRDSFLNPLLRFEAWLRVRCATGVRAISVLHCALSGTRFTWFW